MSSRGALIDTLEFDRDRVPDLERYPFSIPALRGLETLEFHPQVTFLVGENGSGKSTLLEAVAIKAGFNAEGGTRNFSFATRRSHSELCDYVRLGRSGRKVRDGFFLRAESYFNLATEIERLDEPPGAPRVIDSYGGRSLHEQSHGESFLALVKHRFGPDGFYVLDEPEAALSPSRQLSLLAAMHALCAQGSQFVIATHSPMLLAYPQATIYVLDDDGLTATPYDEVDHVQLTRDFLRDPPRYLRYLFE